MKNKILKKLFRYIRGGKPSPEKELEILEQVYKEQVREIVDLICERNSLRLAKKDLEDQVKQLTEQLITISQVNKWVY